MIYLLTFHIPEMLIDLRLVVCQLVGPGIVQCSDPLFKFDPRVLIFCALYVLFHINVALHSACRVLRSSKLCYLMSLGCMLGLTGGMGPS